eukprot:6491661-Amphidinium_carterae.1
MSEISQKIKSVIKFAIRVTTMRNQRETIQEYETTHNTKISDDIKIESVVNSVRGQLRNHLLLNMNETTSFDDIKKTIADFFQSTYVIQQTHSGGQGYQGHQPMEIDQINGFEGKNGKKGKGKSKGPPFKGTGKGKKGKGKQNRNQIQQWGQIQHQQTSYQPSQYHTQYQQPSAKGKNQKGSSSQHKGKGKGKSHIKSMLVEGTCAAVSVATLSFAPHVPLQPIRGDQKLQSVTDAEIRIHGFKKCTIMSGGIGLRVNFIICDVSCPIIGNSTEAAPPVSVATPQEPSAAERELHHLTHIPFRSWCEICVRSKARGTYHKGNLKSKSIIQIDYTFLKNQGEPDQKTKLITVLTM